MVGASVPHTKHSVTEPSRKSRTICAHHGFAGSGKLRSPQRTVLPARSRFNSQTLLPLVGRRGGWSGSLSGSRLSQRTGTLPAASSRAARDRAFMTGSIARGGLPVERFPWLTSPLSHPHPHRRALLQMPAAAEYRFSASAFVS